MNTYKLINHLLSAQIQAAKERDNGIVEALNKRVLDLKAQYNIYNNQFLLAKAKKNKENMMAYLKGEMDIINARIEEVDKVLEYIKLNTK